MGRVSYSQLSLWQNCPFQWKLRYIDRPIKPETNIHLVFGSAMHTVLQEYLTRMYSHSVKQAGQIDLNRRLQEEMVNEFKEAEQKQSTVPCSKEELQEFFQDGVNILEFFIKKRADYFSKKHWSLVGCEVPLNVPLTDTVGFLGYLDVVLYHEPTQRYKILDIKTSTRGWNKYQKMDKMKTSQLLLYKKYYAQQKSIDLDKIGIEYFIVKRKLYENVDWPQKRVQTFEPANGSVSINKTVQSMNTFLDMAFDEQGKRNPDQHATPSKKACRFCEFNQTEYCTEGVI